MKRAFRQTRYLCVLQCLMKLEEEVKVRLTLVAWPLVSQQNLWEGASNSRAWGSLYLILYSSSSFLDGLQILSEKYAIIQMPARFSFWQWQDESSGNMNNTSTLINSTCLILAVWLHNKTNSYIPGQGHRLILEPIPAHIIFVALGCIWSLFVYSATLNNTLTWFGPKELIPSFIQSINTQRCCIILPDMHIETLDHH